MADSKTKPGASTNDVQDPGRRDFIVVEPMPWGDWVLLLSPGHLLTR